jgi:hypothetical protein
MTTIEIIPANPDFAVLEFIPRPEDPNRVRKHPVIAWRITDQTDVVPITSNARINRQQRHYVVQPNGLVYSTEGDVYEHIRAAREAYEASAEASSR